MGLSICALVGIVIVRAKDQSMSLYECGYLGTLVDLLEYVSNVNELGVLVSLLEGVFCGKQLNTLAGILEGLYKG